MSKIDDPVWILNLPFVGWVPNRLHDNRLLRNVWQHVDAEAAAACIHYVKDSEYAEVVWNVKSRAKMSLMRFVMQQVLECKLQDSDFFDDVDYLVPVPTTWWRWLKRGYNPAGAVAACLGELLKEQGRGIPVGDFLKRTKGGELQRHRSAKERLRIENQHFDVRNKQKLAKKATAAARPLHFMIIDDVATTGTTMAACALALKRVLPDCRISLFALAYSGEL